MAFVILHKHHEKTWDGKHDEFAQELTRHAKARLPGFACPEWVQVVEGLPVSPHDLIQPSHANYLSENINRENSQDYLASDGREALGGMYRSIRL